MSELVLVAIITGSASVITAAIAKSGARKQARKLDTIHVLVNSRLSEALAKIIELEAVIAKLLRQ